MSEQAVAEYAAAVRARCGAAGKAEKGAILDEFCRVTGYHRRAAIPLLGRAPRRAVARRGRPPVPLRGLHTDKAASS